MNRLEKFIKIVDAVNDGDWDEYSEYFKNNFKLFLNIVIKHNLLDRLNLDEGSPIMDEHENNVFLALIGIDPNKWYKYICDNIISGDLVEVNGNYYLNLTDLQDLAEFFDNSGRDLTAREAAKLILGEDWWEPFNDTVNDVYDDVIEELNDANLQILKNKMFSVLDGISVDAETDTLVDLKTNELEDSITITSENFDDIFNDDETIKFLIKYIDELYDIKYDLHNIHNNAYNSAYSDEIYTDVWNELGGIFDGKVEHHSGPSKYDPKKTKTWYTIKIKDINHVIYTWLKKEQMSLYNSDTLSYYGSFSKILKECMDRGYYDYLDFRIPDYPDYSLVKKYINENFSDYF